jgi:hypothetical protein
MAPDNVQNFRKIPAGSSAGGMPGGRRQNQHFKARLA